MHRDELILALRNLGDVPPADAAARVERLFAALGRDRTHGTAPGANTRPMDREHRDLVPAEGAGRRARRT